MMECTSCVLEGLRGIASTTTYALQLWIDIRRTCCDRLRAGATPVPRRGAVSCHALRVLLA